jgi:pyruvate carboxylase
MPGDSGLVSVAIHPSDDALSLHVRAADESCEIPGRGARAYLDIEAVIAAARATACDVLHPGYGFLSENALLARRCAEEGIVFVGPSPEALDLFGDKVEAKRLARRCGVPVIEGTSGPTTLDQARAFFASLGVGGAAMIKAIAGGGGRGMRIVKDAAAQVLAGLNGGNGGDAISSGGGAPASAHKIRSLASWIPQAAADSRGNS